ncbi:MAG TPA: response regulator, partial [Longimicrobiales bacterium]|nr:response regulator [Longimicrobiales bacterium]
MTLDVPPFQPDVSGAPTPDSPAPRMAQILIIDDDETLRAVMRKILERRGHVVRDAGNGAVGLSLLRSGRPDVLVTDLYMPEKEGIETIVEVRETWPDLPILAVSGGGSRGSDGSLRDAEALGADASLAKPFTV